MTVRANRFRLSQRLLLRWLPPAAALVACGCCTSLGWFEPLDDRLFDIQARWIRGLHAAAPQASSDADVAVVGIDESTLQRTGVPIALIHRTLAEALEAIARAGARAIAIDLVLPDRSFDRWAPGADASLIQSLSRLRGRVPVVFVVEPDASGRLRAPFAPFVQAVGMQGLVTAQLPLDSDGTVRRFDPNLTAPGLRSLAGEVAARLGRERAVRSGWIDYTRGAPFKYTPLIDVAEAHRSGDELRWRARFGGRVVLVGAVLPFVDRAAQPVSLVGWDYPDTAPPAVLIHAQLLRSVLGRGLIRPIPSWGLVGLAAACAMIAWIAPPGWRWSALGVAALCLMTLAMALHAALWRLPPAAPVAAGLIAVTLRTSLELGRARHEGARLVRAFCGYVSPPLFRALVSGQGGAASGRRAMAFLFADVSGFTAWSERTDAAQAFELLNRYFAVVTRSVHRYGGTIDNFRGDGMMVMFGAPDPHPDPCGAAFDAARDIVALGRSILAAAHGVDHTPLDVAVGVAFGEAVFGDLGGGERRDFTAIGDAVNVAARLQDLSKSLGYPVLLTMDVHGRLDAPRRASGLSALGVVELRGHTPVSIAGWRDTV